MARRTLLACLALSCALLSAEARAAEPGVNAIPGQSMSAPDGAARVGAGWLRIWAVWDAVEPSAGVFSKSIIDAYHAEVAAAKARGIRVLVVVHRSPPWASGVGDLSAPPADPARFGRFMGEFARAVPGVDAWEVWNEPDEPRFFLGAPRPAGYAGASRSG